MRRARAYLLAVAEPPAPALWAFVEAHGPIDAATRVHRRAAPGEVLRETQGRSGYDRVDFDFEIAAQEQARLVIPEDDEWPATQLAALSSLNPAEYRWTAPPLALWVRSKQRLDAACVKAVAIAGTTVPTAYGMTVASDLGAGLTGAGVAVMSGLSRGIAEAALRGALHGGAPAVAVRPCGIDRRDVVGHEGLLDRIAEMGSSSASTRHAPGRNGGGSSCGTASSLPSPKAW
jgi:DNA processing protein